MVLTLIREKYKNIREVKSLQTVSALYRSTHLEVFAVLERLLVDVAGQLLAEKVGSSPDVKDVVLAHVGPPDTRARKITQRVRTMD